VKQSRGQIKVYLAPRGRVARAVKPVGPRIEERDASGTSACGGRVEILNPPQDFHALVTERSAEHPVSGKKDSLEIAGLEGARRWLIKQA
jgi:hypothetical protein